MTLLERFQQQLEAGKDKLFAFLQNDDDINVIVLTIEELINYEIDEKNDIHVCSVPVLKRK